MSHRLHGRRKPYTTIGVRRLPCFRCGKPARTQWQICADHNTYRPLCLECDVAVNRLVLNFMEHPRKCELLGAYMVNVRAQDDEAL